MKKFLSAPRKFFSKAKASDYSQAQPKDEEGPSSSIFGEGQKGNTQTIYERTKGASAYIGRISNEAEKFIDKLGLSSYFPEKISLHDVMKIKRERVGEWQLPDLPWMILRKLLMINYTARDHILAVYTSSDKTSQESTSNVDELEALMAECENRGKGDNRLNPQDVFLVIFLCCDLDLKQFLTEKMFMCHLAVPFIYPTLFGNQTILSLWGMQSIVISGKSESGQTFETTLTTHKSNVVSFVRMGKVPYSKSKLANDVLNETHHETFFNKDCPLGSTQSLLTRGMIEASWYIPSGKENEYFSNITTLLNLRGDVMENHDKLGILSQISNVVVICIELKNLGNKHLDAALEILKKHSANTVIFITAANPKDVDSQNLRDSIKNLMDSFKGLKFTLGFKGAEVKSSDDIKHDAMKKILEHLKKEEGFSLCDFRKVAVQNKVEIDDQDEYCQKAASLMEEVKKTETSFKVQDLLPLQKKWKRWSFLQKQTKRSKESLQIIDSKKKEMQKVREHQQIDTLNPVVKTFAKTLLQIKDDKTTLTYFMKMMKFHLDDTTRKGMYNIEEEIQRGDISQGNLKKKQKYASIGLEHFLREIGQLYESGNIKPKYEALPEVVAKLLLSGHPLEIMDGDTLNVPLKWISAVFDQVKEIVGEKKVLVVSIVGIQSSGKSTLLNTMFGTQFAVSAGRCTRGVYCHLLPVDEKDNFPFEYILVNDTEGLRAPELQGTSGITHDNEIATLAIGLGDITFVNIKGENYSEMQEILQIVVHAFLRMMRVNDKLQFNKTCFFLHQNVSAIDAFEKMSQGFTELENTLNTMAKKVASLEDIQNISTFNDILTFDSEKHAWKFSDLWKGDPPMSPTNPGYSTKVENLKTYLVQQNTQIQRLGYIQAHLGDLWNAILKEDFVFSFRNTLAVIAYHELEQKENEIIKVIDSKIISWVEETAKKDISVSCSAADIDKCLESLNFKLSNFVIDLLNLAKKELENYIDKHKESHIVNTWKQEKLTSMDNRIKDNEAKAKQRLRSLQDEQKIKLLENSDKGYAQAFQKSLYAAALKVQDHKDQDYLKGIFEGTYSRCISDLDLSKTKSTENLDDTIYRVLMKNVPDKNKKLLKDELGHFPLDKPVDIIEWNELYKKTNPKRKKLWRRIKRFVKRPIADPDEDALSKLMKMLDTICSEVETYLSLQAEKGQNVDDNMIQCIFDIVLKGKNEKNRNFNEYEIISVSVYAFGRILPKLQDIQEVFVSKHSNEAKIRKHKEKMWKMFLRVVQQEQGDRAFVDFVCDTLETYMMSSIEKNQQLLDDIVSDALASFSHSKATLMQKVMEDLLDKEIFQDIMEYVNNPSTYTLQWLKSYIDSNYLECDSSQTTKYGKFAEKYIKIMAERIEESTENAKESDTMEKWIATFCHEMGILESDLQSSIHTVIDIAKLSEMLSEQVCLLKEKCMKTMEGITALDICWCGTPPHKTIYDMLWGCQDICPFCSEPCMWGKHTGQDHQCIQHRPGGVCGVAENTTDCLVIATCNFYITGETLFACSACNYTCSSLGKCDGSHTDPFHPYRQYSKVIPGWDIAPDRSIESSDYWLWIMSKFKLELADYYDAEVPDIPGSWCEISKEQAKESLKRNLR